MSNEVRKLRFIGDNGRDEFFREQVADKVIKLLCSDIDVSPMVVDGYWGTGKTEFCHKLINKFKDEHENYRILYVDAFRADHADDALMTILAEVLSLIPKDQKENFLQKAVPVIRFGIKALLKAGVSHVLRENADDVADELEEHIQDTANAAIDATVRAMLKDHERAEQSLEALQATLRDIAKSNPIVIFIDELDRCRPNYAVQVLEVIKHTFDVEGVSFVLVTNTLQLKAAVNHEYGAVVDAQRYLDKFLKFRFELPNFIPSGGYSKYDVSDRHFDACIEQSDILKVSSLRQGRAPLNEFCKCLLKINKISLREIEAFVRYLSVYSALNRNYNYDFDYGFEAIKIFSIFIYCFRPDVKNQIIFNIYDGESIYPLLGITETISGEDFDFCDFIEVFAWYIGSQFNRNNGYWDVGEDVSRLAMKEQFKNGFRSIDYNQKAIFDEFVKVFDVLSLA
ncbi:KAP family P-loop NTPase fold protein [Thalassolituus oleivorans]|uniref:KAP NTPase domain-containing protein n=1 Tax=Thalassolituus oleivorans MIL-1 TaxID=1298593 RepID=M5E0Q9_9GAMM|nr:P-loop NTPase fold protein [Thalassolituus oleivorans]CCU71299.1 hypothetical protein TOL_0863 [Thalassolituus oleivorans MIL-1]